MPADGFGDSMFAQTDGVNFLSGGFELVDQLENKSARVGHFDERRQGIEQVVPTRTKL